MSEKEVKFHSIVNENCHRNHLPEIMGRESCMICVSCKNAIIREFLKENYYKTCKQCYEELEELKKE